MPDLIDQVTAARRRLDVLAWADSMFEVRNAASAVAEVYIYGAIGFDVIPMDFVEQLAAITAPNVEVHIHSPGGSVFDGIAILNALRAHEAHILVTVDGLAASAASFIAMAGDEIVVAPNAEMMVHDPSGLCVGASADMRQMAQMLDHAGDNIASMYAARAGGTVADWRTAMAAETWYSAEEAVAAGLADRVGEIAQPNPKPQARFDTSIFNFSGRREAPGPQHPAPQPVAGPTNPERTASVDLTTEQLNSLRQRFGLADDADENTIRDAMLADPAPDPVTPPAALPDGLVPIDAATLDGLRADAAAGREARAQQLADRRTALVNGAVQDGRIPPARREAWLAQLEADSGAEQVLAGLAKGLVPVTELGTAAADLETESDRLYNELYPKEGVTA